MNQKVRVGQSSTIVTLTTKDYRAAGGQASIYAVGGSAYKIYHDPKKTLLPQSKMVELAQIHDDNVIRPRELLYDAKSGEPVGYMTEFVDDVHSLVKFFTKAFKISNNLDLNLIVGLVKWMQQVVSNVHSAKCLVVDLNELNVLVKISKHLEPFFIDTDSYATPSFKATAIMDSVRDRRVSTTKNGKLHYSPDEMSDWFSWGVLAFWLYTNIHPYQGRHPKYKPNESRKQMDDGVSVFHPDVRVPPVVMQFSLIPRRHLDWFRAVFLNNDRSVPPLPDISGPIAVPTQIVIVKSTDKLEIKEIAAFAGPIVDFQQFMGVKYGIGKDKVYNEFGKVVFENGTRIRKTLLCTAPDGTLVAASLWGGKVEFTEVLSRKPIGTISSLGMFMRNKAIYTMCNGKLVENSFVAIGSNIAHRTKETENVSNYTAAIYDGCLVQDLLNHIYVTVPYAPGRSTSKYIHELDGHRVIDAKGQGAIVVIVAEHNGKYFRFIIVFDFANASYTLRKVPDISYDTINFTVLENGVCLLLASPTELEIFTNNDKYEVIPDPPFDSTMPLVNTPDGAFFINNNSVHKIKRK